VRHVRLTRLAVTVLLVVASAALTGAGQAPMRRACGPQPTWDKTGCRAVTFDDEFSRPFASRWQAGWLSSGVITGPVNSEEIACYSSRNVSESGGYLNLALRHQSSSCGGSEKPWTGALVNTSRSFNQAGGTIEMRFCDDGNSGGVDGWPALWSNGPASTPWPKHGEIDDLEGLGGGTAAHLHYVSGFGAEEGPGWYSRSPVTGCHIYGETWSTAAKTVTFYWDSHKVWTSAFTATEPEYIVIDYTMSGDSVTPPAQSTVKVDWVRAWRT